MFFSSNEFAILCNRYGGSVRICRFASALQITLTRSVRHVHSSFAKRFVILSMIIAITIAIAIIMRMSWVWVMSLTTLMFHVASTTTSLLEVVAFSSIRRWCSQSAQVSMSVLQRARIGAITITTTALIRLSCVVHHPLIACKKLHHVLTSWAIVHTKFRANHKLPCFHICFLIHFMLFVIHLHVFHFVTYSKSLFFSKMLVFLRIDTCSIIKK